ncbi:hypothetical protein BDU57DRAFT_67975 [Ampelomyces quisqualis]|uniref:Uncharacterized protein n=1 Tax=Ampelomyces quisqualis TaxID=50730 RepID=A0A6A5R1K6_AMPQU|nr:hypothetical protein BDU57DRAFT_67975 [Ampelomyces quisqualis]
MVTQVTPNSDKPTSCLHGHPDNVHLEVQHVEIYSADSGAITPISDRSSFSNASSVSSISALSRPSKSSMKSSLKSTPSALFNTDRRSSPPTVRFAEPEPTPRPKSTLIGQQRQPYSRSNGAPNPLLLYRHRPASSVPGPASSRYSLDPQAHLVQPPESIPTPQPVQLRNPKIRTRQRFSAPILPSQSNPRRSSAQGPANFTPPSLALEHRVSSFRSATSTLSVQSAPAALQTPIPTPPPGLYNPLDHYIPCLRTSCTAVYSPTLNGPTYYLPQGPYSLPKHHGYCPHHASQDLQDANAWCKRNWERLRQNAGRKTLGEIAIEFEEFLHDFRATRRRDAGTLKTRIECLVLGTRDQDQDGQEDSWDWTFTPRHCTRAACRSPAYSPYATHLYAFYHTPCSLTFTPLATLCSTCAAVEVEAFERMVGEKWGSRCGWDEGEWGVWFDGVVGEREKGREFWEKAQQRDVGERRARKTDGDREGQGLVDQRKVEGERKQVGKKKSVFKRFFEMGRGSNRGKVVAEKYVR